MKKSIKNLKNLFSVKKLISCILMLTMLTAMTACSDESGKSADENSEIKGITGTWIEVSVYPRTLTVKEDGTYTLDEDNGKVTIEKRPLVRTGRGNAFHARWH